LLFILPFFSSDKKEHVRKPQVLPAQFFQQMISFGTAARITKAIGNITIHSVQIRKRSEKKNKKVTRLGSNVSTVTSKIGKGRGGATCNDHDAHASGWKIVFFVTMLKHEPVHHLVPCKVHLGASGSMSV
jgi:hypothetical protein